MAVIKVACPKCGQKVSGDEAFYGKLVDCPICTARIEFPENPNPAPVEAVPPAQSPPVSSIEPVPPAGAATSTSVANNASPSGLPPVPEFPEVPQRQRIEKDEPRIDSDEDEIPSPLLGIISLVVGILNTVTFCIGGILLAPLAIILGHSGMARAKRSPVQPAPGQTLALIGTILGYAGLAFLMVALVILVIFKDRIPMGTL